MRRTRRALQRLDRARDREIGLASAGRADAEGEIVAVRICSRYWRWFGPRPRIAPRCVWTSTSPAVRDSRDLAAVLGPREAELLHARCTRSGVIGSLADSSNIRRAPPRRVASGPDRARDLQSVTAPPHVDAESLLDVAQVLLHRAREVGEPVVVSAFAARSRAAPAGSFKRRSAPARRAGRAANSASPR